MLKFTLGCAVAMALSLPAYAQQVMAVYDTQISQQDLLNSHGQRLGNFCAVIQQDRANYHRFGRRDGPDQGDPIFGDKVMRGRIVNTCELADGNGYLHDFIMGGDWVGVMLRFTVLNDAGRMRVLVSERAG